MRKIIKQKTMQVSKKTNFALWALSAVLVFVLLPQGSVLAKKRKANDESARSILVVVEDQNGDPVANASVTGWSEQEYGSGITNEQGEASMTVSADNDGLWYLSVMPPEGYSFGFAHEVEVEDEGETIVTIIVRKTDAQIEITLKDADGEVVTLTTEEAAWINCRAGNDFENSFSGNIMGLESGVTLDVVAGTYQCDAYVFGKGATGGEVTIASGQVASLDITVLEYDAEILFRYVDKDGNTLTDISSFQVFANTIKDSDGADYYGNFVGTTGESGEATLEVLSGFTYQVGGFIAEEGGFGGGPGGPGGEEGMGEGEGEGEGEWGEGEEGGEGECPEEATQEECDQWSSGEGEDEWGEGEEEEGNWGHTGIRVTSEGKTYLQNYQMTEIVPEVGDNIIEVELTEADATLEVEVLDANGDPIKRTFVMASEGDIKGMMEGGEGEGEGPGHDWSGFVSGITNSSGVAELAVASDTTYEVSAFPEGSHGGNSLPPQKKKITLEKGETARVVMQAQEADWTVNITATPPEGVDLEFQFCYAFSPELGIENFDEPFDDDITIEIVRNVDWYLGCMGYGNDQFYRSDDKIVTPDGKKDGSSDVPIALKGAGNYYGKTSYSLSPTTQNTITMPDEESTLVLPANFVSDSGNVTLTVETATQYTVDDDNFPVQAYEFTLTGSDGQEISDTFSQNVTFNAAYDPEFVEEKFDVTETTFNGASYSEDTNAWQSPVSTKLDAENDRVAITLNHFSTYAVVADRGLSTVEEGEDESVELPGVPRKLSATKIKKTGATLTWKKAKGSTVTSYKVQVRKNKVTKKNKWTKYNNVTKTQRKITKLKANKVYQFRVRAVNTGGSSAWSAWKKFRTKK